MEVENFGGSFFDEIWNLWLIFNLFIIIFWEFVVFFVKGLVGVFVLRVLLMINFLCVGVLIVVFLDICCFLWVDERCRGVVVMVFKGIMVNMLVCKGFIVNSIFNVEILVKFLVKRVMDF